VILLNAERLAQLVGFDFAQPANPSLPQSLSLPANLSLPERSRRQGVLSWNFYDSKMERKDRDSTAVIF